MSAQSDNLEIIADLAVSTDSAAATAIRQLVSDKAALAASNTDLQAQADALKATQVDDATLQAIADKLTPANADLAAAVKEAFPPPPEEAPAPVEPAPVEEPPPEV